MSRQEAPNPRQHFRRACRGAVSLQSIGTGPLFVRGDLLDLGGGGARVAVDCPLEEGTVVSMTLPARRADAGHGRKLLGRVVHAVRKGDRHEIGVEFGWETATGAQHEPRRTGLWSRLRGAFSGRSVSS